MVATTREARLWSPGPGLTVLGGLTPPLGHHLYLLIGRRDQRCTEKTLPALCPPPSPADQRLSTGHTPTGLPTSPAPMYPHSADIGKRKKNEGIRGEKRELGYSRMRHHTASWGCYFTWSCSPPLQTLVKALSLPYPPSESYSDTRCPLRGKWKNTAQGHRRTHT